MVSSNAQPSDADNQVTCPRCNLAFSPAQPQAEASQVGEAPPRSGTLVLGPGQLPAAPPVATPTGTPSHVGRFEIRLFVGEGAFGRVYEAYDPSLKRIVALKVARAEQLTSDNRIRRFQREAQNAALLLHPHIVALFDSGQDGSQHYIASAFIDGQPLDAVLEVLPEGQTLPQRQAVQLVRKLAEALAYAHQQGVIHRDLKPGNVMLRKDGEPLVMDFGLAARSDEVEKLTQDGSIMGTPQYMAPEQWRGQAEAASDQYSLGCLLFELLTGRLPFVAGSSVHYMHLHCNEPVPSARQVRPDVPRDLDTICRKSLEKEPGQRYQNCQELADDLRRFLDGESVSVRPPGAGERLVKWARRSPAMASLTGALLLGVLVAGYFAVKPRQAQQQAEEQRDSAALSAYVNRITVAQAEWEYGSTALAWHHLQLCQKNLRGWEHDYLATLFNKVPTFRGHTDPVTSVAFSPDGKRIISTSLRKVKVWDADKGTETLSINGSPNAVSPNGKRIASATRINAQAVDSRRELKVWDTDTGAEMLTLMLDTKWVTSMWFSHDGKRLISGGIGAVKVWDVDKGTETLTLQGNTKELQRNNLNAYLTILLQHQPFAAVASSSYFLTVPTLNLFYSVAFSPDGKRIVSANVLRLQNGRVRRELKVWDADKGTELRTLKGHNGGITNVSFSQDGKRIVGASDDNTVKVWDADMGTETLTLKGHKAPVLSVGFSPDGKRIVSASADNTVKVWDADKGTETFTLKGHTDSVTSVAFSADGKRIVSGSKDTTVKVWDADTDNQTLLFKEHLSGVTSVSFSPDGQRIASASADRTVKVWDAAKGTEFLTLKGHTAQVNSVSLSPDGQRIVSAGGGLSTRSNPDEVMVWDTDKGTGTLILKGHTGTVSSVSFSPDGQRIIGASGIQVKLWDADKGTETLTLRGHSGIVTRVAFSADGKRIVSCAGNNFALGEVKVWDADKGTEIRTLKGHTDGVTSVAFSPDGKRIVSSSTDKTVKVWDVDKGTETLTLKGHTSRVNSVAFSPDGQRIVSGSDDKMVKLWDADKGIETLTLKGHTGAVTCVSFSPDGKRLVSASQDGTVTVWDAAKAMGPGAGE